MDDMNNCGNSCATTACRPFVPDYEAVKNRKRPDRLENYFPSSCQAVYPVGNCPELCKIYGGHDVPDDKISNVFIATKEIVEFNTLGGPVGMIASTYQMITSDLETTDLQQQRFATCLKAFAKIYLLPEYEWDALDMDDVLQEGQRLYEESQYDPPVVDEIPSNYYEFEVQIKREFFYDNYEFSIELDDRLLVEDKYTHEQTIADIGVVITKFFKDIGRYCLIMLDDWYLLVWQNRGMYFILDFNGRRVDTFETDRDGGSAMFLSLRTIDNIVHLIVNMSNLFPETTFSLRNVRLIKFQTPFGKTMTRDSYDRTNEYIVVNTDYAYLPAKVHLSLNPHEHWRNRSALATAVATLIATKIDHPATWNTKVLDRLICYGANVCRCCCNSCFKDNFPIQIDEFIRVYRMGQFIINFWLEPHIHVGLWRCLPNYKQSELSTSIQQAFANGNDKLVIQIEYQFYPIWKKHDFYYIFDVFRHRVPGNLFLNNINVKTASLRMLRSLDMFLNVFNQMLLETTVTNKYYIHALRIRRIENVDNLSSKPFNDDELRNDYDIESLNEYICYEEDEMRCYKELDGVSDLGLDDQYVPPEEPIPISEPDLIEEMEEEGEGVVAAAFGAIETSSTDEESVHGGKGDGKGVSGKKGGGEGVIGDDTQAAGGGDGQGITPDASGAIGGGEVSAEGSGAIATGAGAAEGPDDASAGARKGAGKGAGKGTGKGAGKDVGKGAAGVGAGAGGGAGAGEGAGKGAAGAGAGEGAVKGATGAGAGEGAGKDVGKGAADVGAVAGGGAGEGAGKGAAGAGAGEGAGKGAGAAGAGAAGGAGAGGGAGTGDGGAGNDKDGKGGKDETAGGAAKEDDVGKGAGKGIGDSKDDTGKLGGGKGSDGSDRKSRISIGEYSVRIGSVTRYPYKTHSKHGEDKGEGREEQSDDRIPPYEYSPDDDPERLSEFDETTLDLQKYAAEYGDLDGLLDELDIECLYDIVGDKLKKKKKPKRKLKRKAKKKEEKEEEQEKKEEEKPTCSQIFGKFMRKSYKGDAEPQKPKLTADDVCRSVLAKHRCKLVEEERKRCEAEIARCAAERERVSFHYNTIDFENKPYFRCQTGNPPAQTDECIPMSVVGSESCTFEILMRLLHSGFETGDRVLLLTQHAAFGIFSLCDGETTTYYLHYGSMSNLNHYRYYDLNHGTRGFIFAPTITDVANCVGDVLASFEARGERPRTRREMLEEIFCQYLNRPI